jgi:hypothetical protein
MPERVTGLQALIPLIPTKEEIANIKEAADKGSGAFFLPPFFCFAHFREFNFVHHELKSCVTGLPLGPPERFLQSLSSISALEVVSIT